MENGPAGASFAVLAPWFLLFFFVLGYSVDIPVFSRHHQMVVPIGFIGVSDRAGNVTAPHVVGV